MGMKFGFLGSVLVLLALGLLSCGNTALTNAGSGILYVTAQADASVSGISAYGIDLTTGVLNGTSNYGVPTGNRPGAIVESPSGNALFVANIQDNTISSYTVNSDGTLTPAANPTKLNPLSELAPMGMAIDSGGKFLFVANQGTLLLAQPNPPIPNFTPVSGSISVFSINGATLTEIAGSPFSAEPPNPVVGSGPVSVAVAPNANYLYVANQFANNVSVFSIASNGALTQIVGTAISPPGAPPYPVGTAPSAVALTPDGNFLYVANTGSNNITAFFACTNANLDCAKPPTGLLTPVAGSPFSAGLGPVAITAAMDIPGDEFLFVVDQVSNQVSQYKVAVGTGVLSPASPATLSTGAGPSAIVIRPSGQPVLADGGTTNYLYVANTTAGTISSFSYDTTEGVLQVITGSSVTTPGQPAGLAVK